jgi:hypothetical protein
MLFNFIPHAAMNLLRFAERILHNPLDQLRMLQGRQLKTADIYDEIVLFGQPDFIVFREVVGHLNAAFAHHFYRLPRHRLAASKTGAGHVHAVRAELPRERFGHLAAAAVSEAHEQYVFHSLARNSS